LPANAVQSYGWQPGQSGNPLGRAVEKINPAFQEKRFRNALLDVLKEPSERAPKTRKTKLMVVVAKLVSMASQGDIQAIRMIGERIDGPIPLPTLSAPDGTPISPYGSAQEPTSAMLVVRWGEPRAIARQPNSDSASTLSSDNSSAPGSPQAQPRSDLPPVLELEAEELPMLELRGPQST
jgi:hypothetical protein